MQNCLPCHLLLQFPIVSTHRGCPAANILTAPEHARNKAQDADIDTKFCFFPISRHSLRGLAPSHPGSDGRGCAVSGRRQTAAVVGEWQEVGEGAVLSLARHVEVGGGQRRGFKNKVRFTETLILRALHVANSSRFGSC